jgi:hypothetical protein
MNSFMNSSQHSIDLLNLSLLFSGFEVTLLKKAFVLCLKDEYTDSTKLLSPKGLHVVSQAELLENFPQPRSDGALSTTNVGPPSQCFRTSSTKSFVASAFLDPHS